MASRLALIISQAARRDTFANEVVEDLVTQAMFAQGIDANLIGSLDTIAPGSTDHLCLQGNSRDLVLATWLEIGAARAAWKNLDLEGQFVDFIRAAAGEPLPAPDAVQRRRIYFYHLTSRSDSATVLDLCKKLHSIQQVALVPIQLSGVASTKPISNSPTVQGISADRHPSSETRPTLPLAHADSTSPSRSASGDSTLGQTTSSPRRAEPSSVPPHSPLQTHADEEWTSLDQLVDDLDALDL